jgi:adenylyltransferase/sulfurtransferase
MRDIGLEGQKKLKAAKVLLIGAGGLGSPAALYLAGAGIGTLGLVDADTVDESNLHRQVIHTEKTLGMPKVDSAK